MIKFIDLFCGLGGFRIAFESFGAKCVFSSDIDQYARETYKLNFGEYPTGDITKVDEKDIPDHDVLCAGFPCQPFSIGGKRLGFEDTRGTLFFDVLRILNEKRPSAFFLENVAGLCNHDDGRTIDIILTSLRQIGYQSFFKVINAKDVGYPQNRARWYCVGFDKERFKNIDDKFEFNFPKKRELIYTVDSFIEDNVSSDYSNTETCQANIMAHIDEFKNSNRYTDDHVLSSADSPFVSIFCETMLVNASNVKLKSHNNITFI